MNNYFKIHDDVYSKCVYGNEARSDVDLTIVVPTYKREHLLKVAVSSLVNQKQPKSLSYQVIIVSNESEFNVSALGLDLDKTIFSVYVNESNLGMVGNMNRCASIAKGKYIAYLQDDDVLLDTYLLDIEAVLNEEAAKDIDCIIPNRYYYFDKSNKDSNFGAKAYSKEKLKELLKDIVCIGTKEKMFQQVKPRDCALTWYNCFGGGPTCGIVFRREAMLATCGFDERFPYAFDYVFFVGFSEQFNTVLYNKYLAIYRMSDSASNRPDVQVDFYRSDMYLLDYMVKREKYIRFFRNEIEHFSYKNKSSEAQKLLGERKRLTLFKKVKYLVFRCIRFILLMRSNLYRKQIVPELVEQKLM